MKLITLESIFVWETSLTRDEVSLDESWANLGLEIDNFFGVTFDHHFKAGMGIPFR